MSQSESIYNDEDEDVVDGVQDDDLEADDDDDGNEVDNELMIWSIITPSIIRIIYFYFLILSLLLFKDENQSKRRKVDH